MSIYRNLSTHTPNRNVAHVHYDSLCVPMLLQASPFDWCGCRRWQGRWKSEQNKEVFLRSDPSISFREKKNVTNKYIYDIPTKCWEREKSVASNIPSKPKLDALRIQAKHKKKVYVYIIENQFFPVFFSHICMYVSVFLSLISSEAHRNCARAISSAIFYFVPCSSFSFDGCLLLHVNRIILLHLSVTA